MAGRLSVTIALLCGLATWRCGDAQEDPMMHWRSSASEIGNLASQIASSKDRTAAAAARAQSASLRTAASDAMSRRLHVEALAKKATLADLSNQATAQADKAAVASKSATATLKEMKASEASVLAQASSMAVDEVRSFLAGQYEEKDAWRQQTLRDWNTEASDAAAKAALPYQRMAQHTRATAQRLQVQANAAAARAAVATKHQADVDALEASARPMWTHPGAPAVRDAQSLDEARARLAAARQSEAVAQTLKANAAEADAMVGAYTNAAAAAAANAARTADPFGMPPLPVANIANAFLPPR